ncbi:MAG TPA: ATP-binding cassette domain-containing protein, partial [Actinoplanes sp.]|nr:ATP-binding cassette domain-containing protein [Actinoplanes sp.]
MSLLRVNDLTVKFGDVTVVDGLGFELPKGGSLGIVGESGSGKSMTSLAVMGLLPKGALCTGGIAFDGVDLNTLSERRMREIRGD